LGEEKAGYQHSQAKYGSKTRPSLSVIIKRYEECELEPQFRPEFVKEIEER
jgi:hypothetical protein